MTAVTTQSRSQAGTTPVPITPTASDTIAAGQFGPAGVSMRLITTGTTTTLTVADPTTTGLGNPGTVTGVVMPATGVREIFIPLAAINQAASPPSASLAFTGALTGVTYELYRV